MTSLKPILQILSAILGKNLHLINQQNNKHPHKQRENEEYVTTETHDIEHQNNNVRECLVEYSLVIIDSLFPDSLIILINQIYLVLCSVINRSSNPYFSRTNFPIPKLFPF